MAIIDMLKRTVKNSIRKATSKAVTSAVEKAVEPQVTKVVNKAADSISCATKSAQSEQSTTSNLDSAFERLRQNTEAFSKEMELKIFCPSCGSSNSIDSSFCKSCGTKLPKIDKNQKVKKESNFSIEQWNEKLTSYPVWNCGGTNYEFNDWGKAFSFSAYYRTNKEAREAVINYRALAKENGFEKNKGLNEKDDILKKTVNGVCYVIDTAHLFEGDDNCVDIYFYTE